MLRWLLGFIVKHILNEFEPVVQEEVKILFSGILDMVKGSKTPQQLLEDLTSHFELFKKANS